LHFGSQYIRHIENDTAQKRTVLLFQIYYYKRMEAFCQWRFDFFCDSDFWILREFQAFYETFYAIPHAVARLERL